MRQRKTGTVEYLLFYDKIGQEEVALFLRELLRRLPGLLIVLLDNSTTHNGRPIEQLRRWHRRRRIEHFPGYAPD